MDFITIIIGTMTIGLFILPFAATSINKKNREKKFSNALTQMANIHSDKLSYTDYCGSIALSMDTNHKRLYFARLENNEISCQYLNLRDVDRCQLIKTNTKIKSGSPATVQIQKLELAFSLKSKTIADPTWQLFGSDQDFRLIGELHLGEKWVDLINKQLKTQRNNERVVVNDLV